MQDRRGRTTSAIPSTYFHYVQRSNGRRRARKLIQLEDGCPFQKWGFDVQSIPVQLGADGDEVVWRPQTKFYKFL